tara:strand:- start:54 stop:308 length:255 start_codon:yes stop_codon:yes gene_type:complete
MVIILPNRDCLVYSWLYRGSYINMNKKKTMHTIRSMFFDLKNEKDIMGDFANITYDVGYMVALCIALKRKRVADRIYDYFLKGW